MAITVLSGSPQSATPAYNKMIFKVSGSLTSGANYRYVCDVKNSAGTTTLVRLKCDKLPTTNYGFFDVSKVIQTLIAPTAPTLTQTGFADHAGYYSGYRLAFMEEYGATPVVQTGTVTTVSGNVAFAGNLEQLELQDWTLIPYFRTGTSFASIKPLTTPTSFTVYQGGKAWLAINATKFSLVFANDSWLVSGRIVYKGVNYNIAVNPSLSGTTDYNIQRFGCGPAQLSGTIAALSGAVEGDSYTVQFFQIKEQVQLSRHSPLAHASDSTRSQYTSLTSTEASIRTPSPSRTASERMSAGRPSATTRMCTRPLTTTRCIRVSSIMSMPQLGLAD